MSYATCLAVLLTSLPSLDAQVRQVVEQAFERQREAIHGLLLEFLMNVASPEAAYALERKLQEKLREFGRDLVEVTFNSFEPEEAQAQASPQFVQYEAGEYRRLAKKTPRRVSTLFGDIVLERYAFRYRQREAGEAAIFPLEQDLGLVHGATPALAEAAVLYLAEAGATQRSVLERLKHHHAVAWGPPRLRDVARDVAEGLRALREEMHAQRLLGWLEQARQSRGNRKPVLAVGRDGVTLREYQERTFHEASVGTVTVYDRAGKRLGTVYLAYAPEEKQPTLTRDLTALLRRVLSGWEGPLPRLCYITDSGDRETGYYRDVLRRFRHPRTGERLCWQRIVDYYHAAQRIWTMAGLLFPFAAGAARAWARRMCRLLKKPQGVFRVLHSAAALRAARRWSPSAEEDFRKAYRYLRERTCWMRYHAYQNDHLPIGSGVTEAACRTLFTQRLKLSGMRWSNAGSQVVLDLRVMLLSGVWREAYAALLKGYQKSCPRVPERCAAPSRQKAA